MNSNKFSSYYPISCIHLPLTLMTLNEWALVIVDGPDSEKYLQGQITADIKETNEHRHLLTAHCNANGKMWSVLRLFRYGNGFAFIERYSLLDLQLIELKKYAIFSKVNIAVNNNLVLLGVAGFHARTALTNLFNELPTVKKQIVNDNVTTILWFKYPTERFMLITNKLAAKHITTALYHSKALFNDSQQWLSLDIEAGIPTIDVVNSGKFTPQATNLQTLGAINFKKGCYIGQEILARIKLHNANKYIMLYLNGIASRIPIAGEKLELKVSENYWRRTGTVLAAVQLSDGHLLVQAVINKNIESNSLLRVCNDAISVLCIKSLPYSLKESTNSDRQEHY